MMFMMPIPPTTRETAATAARSKLMTREAAVYRFTPLGEAAWRTERFVEGGPAPSAG